MIGTHPRLISELYPAGEFESELALSKLDQQKKTCCHYWLIDRPNGPYSRGVCKYCHEERDFLNSPVSKFNRDNFVKHDRATDEYLKLKREERILSR